MNTVLHWAEAQSGGTAMNVTIIGAGNIGTYFAVEFSAKGHHVIVHSSRPSLVNNLIVMMDVDANEKKIGKIASVTSDMAQAVQDAELLIVTHAAFMLEETANRMYDYIKS
jgi:glycerol-3-phosphate dehydrogenase